MWLQFEDGPSTTDRIAEHLARLYGLAPSEVYPSIIDILEKWKLDGWLTQNQDGSWSVPQMPSEEAKERNQLHPCMRIPDCDGRVLLWKRRLEIYDKAVELSVWGIAEQASSDEFARLRGFLSGFPDALPTKDLEEISLIFGKNGVALKTLQETLVFQTFIEVSASLHSLLMRAAARETHTFATLHAAAVSREQGTILMPAVSGSGKTTLTSYLLQRGWRYGGDDIVGVGWSGDPGPLELLPFPTAMGIKDGSVSVLEADYPQITKILPINYGQKTARFLPVDSNLWTPNSGSWRSIRAIVFPQYRAQAGCDLQEATQEEALRAILEAGIGTYARAENGRFELLFELIRVTPSYRLCYSELADANRCLLSLFS